MPRIGLSVTDEENPRAVSLTELAQPSFESDNDAMKLEIRPHRKWRQAFELNFESGFIALLGRGISKGVEGGFFNGPPRGDRQGAARAIKNDHSQRLRKSRMEIEHRPESAVQVNV